jgi:hypothetical protein
VSPSALDSVHQAIGAVSHRPLEQRAANYARAQQGKWHGSGRSFGYTERLEVVEAGASLRSIARDLNDRG